MSNLIERLRNEIALHDSLTEDEEFEFIKIVTFRDDVEAVCAALEQKSVCIEQTRFGLCEGKQSHLEA